MTEEINSKKTTLIFPFSYYQVLIKFTFLVFFFYFYLRVRPYLLTIPMREFNFSFILKKKQMSFFLNANFLSDSVIYSFTCLFLVQIIYLHQE